MTAEAQNLHSLGRSLFLGAVRTASYCEREWPILSDSTLTLAPWAGDPFRGKLFSKWRLVEGLLPTVHGPPSLPPHTNRALAMDAESGRVP